MTSKERRMAQITEQVREQWQSISVGESARVNVSRGSGSLSIQALRFGTDELNIVYELHDPSGTLSGIASSILTGSMDYCLKPLRGFLNQLLRLSPSSVRGTSTDFSTLDQMIHDILQTAFSGSFKSTTPSSSKSDDQT
jgi:hypothetical protein